MSKKAQLVVHGHADTNAPEVERTRTSSGAPRRGHGRGNTAPDGAAPARRAIHVLDPTARSGP
jgi:hypothetical protein